MITSAVESVFFIGGTKSLGRTNLQGNTGGGGGGAVHSNVSYPDASDTGTSLYRAPSAWVPMAKCFGFVGLNFFFVCTSAYFVTINLCNPHVVIDRSFWYP